MFWLLRDRLEVQLQRKLYLPRRCIDQGAADLVEVGTVERGIRLPQDRMVEDVEHLAPELKPLLSVGAEREVLHERKIKRPHAGTDQRVPSGVAERIGRRKNKRTCIPECAGGLWSRVGIPDNVRPRRAAGVAQVSRCADRRRPAGLKRQDAAGLPAAENLIQNAVGQEPVTGAERNFVDEIRGQPLARIEGREPVLPSQLVLR